MTLKKPLSAWPYAAGVIYGLIILARIDGAFYVVLVGGAAAWFHIKNYRFGKFTAGALAFIFIPALVSAPWWFYNVAFFGSLVPTSGCAESLGAPDLWGNITALLRAICPTTFLLPHLGVITRGRYFLLEAAGFFAAVWAVLTLVGRFRRFGTDAERTRNWRYFQWPLVAFVLMLALIYTVKFTSVYFFDRYLAVAWVWLIPAYSACIVIFAARPSRWRRPFAICATAAFAGLNLAFHGVAYFKSAGVAAEFYRDQVLLVDNLVPPYVPVGAMQTGTLGYFRDDVVNLDGKVNAAALRHRLMGNMSHYLATTGVIYLADWHEKIMALLDTREARVRYVKVATRGRFELWRVRNAPGPKTTRRGLGLRPVMAAGAGYFYRPPTW